MNISNPPPGKTDITSMLLDARAEKDLVNSVCRTAAQMAAFVGEAGSDWVAGSLVTVTVVTSSPIILLPGQHDCVTVINNFFSLARLEYYTKPQGVEREPRLPPRLAGPLHKIIMTTNLNPVKVRPAKDLPTYSQAHWHLIACVNSLTCSWH